MAIYELRCETGHVFEVIQSFSAPLPACACGRSTAKVPSTFGVSGSASLPPPPEHMPQTWKGTYGGDRDYVTELRRTAERRAEVERRHPELRGDARPIIAHEGQFERQPLRKGDPFPPVSPGHSHAAGEGHTHPPH